MAKLSKFNLVFSFNRDLDLVYNSLYGSLLLVSREIGFAIKNRDLNTILADSEVYSQLRALNVVLDDDVDEDYFYLEASRSSRLYSKAISMFLGLTSRCNLACKYCYQSYRPTIEGHDLAEKEWRILHGFLERRVKVGCNSIAVALYGGEPLLNSQMVKVVVSDVNKLSLDHGIRVDLTLITNGTILNSDVEGVVNAVNTIQVTIDGPRETHNARRPFKDGSGSFDTITNNLVKFVDIYNKRVGVRVNVDEFNIDQARELVNFLVELGVHKKLEAIDLSPVYPDQAGFYNPLKTSKTYYEYMTSISKKIVEVLEYAVELGFKVTKVFIKGPCMCRHLHSYAIDEKLNVYMCPAYMYGEPVGKIISEKAAILLPERYYPAIYDPSCVKDCRYAPMCYGGCIYLRSKNVPTCLRVLYGEEHLERLVRAYAISKYREVAKSAEFNTSS